MKWRRRVVIASLLGTGFLLGQLPPPTELKAAIERFKQDFQRGDFDRAVQLWTKDAKEIVPGKVLDRAGIRSTLQETFKSAIFDFRDEDQEYFPGGDTAVTTTRTLAFDDSGNQKAVIRYMTLWKKVDGRWRIYREICVPVAIRGTE